MQWCQPAVGSSAPLTLLIGSDFNVPLHGRPRNGSPISGVLLRARTVSFTLRFKSERSRESSRQRAAETRVASNTVDDAASWRLAAQVLMQSQFGGSEALILRPTKK